MRNHKQRLSPAVVLASLSLVVSVSGTAYAAGGGPFLLGAKNKAGKTTALTVKGSATALKLTSKGGSAASFTSGPGQPPFTVGSSVVVPGLNADSVDGLDASTFRKKTDPVDAATLDGLDSTQFQRSDATPIVASVLRLSGEVTHSGQGATLHPDFEVFDFSNLHSGGSEFMTAPRDGTYVISATIAWDANSTGYRNSGLYGPSGTFANAIGPATAFPAVTYQNLSGVEHLAAGQSVHIEVLQGSGADINVRVNRFEMGYVGP